MRPGDPNDRRRRILGFSRDAATPRELGIELNAEGTAYAVLQEMDEEFPEYWPLLFRVLQEARRELTRQEIYERWPGDAVRPHKTTLWRWLDKVLERGLIVTTGEGRQKDPYRYCLPQKLEAWKNDPIYELAQTMRESEKLLPKQGYELPMG